MKLISPFILLLAVFLMPSCKAPNTNAHDESSKENEHHKFTNHLIHENSPYLLQHAHNPVNWYPWGKEALAKAKTENKMMIISIGYAACHWCHVMEHESFEDTTVAKIMNDNFVCIKIDREERPDIDDVYMTACHIASGRSCGWPLNAFAMPDTRPVWAGTYFPKDDWVKVLNQFVDIKTNDPDKLEKWASELTNNIQSSASIGKNTADQNFNADALNKIAENFMQNIDFKKGGRKGAPKFPMPNNYEFLLRYHYLNGNTKAFDAVKTTLDKMADGGIYDQIGGGFSRYSTDDHWLVPHFEKMLYDNGQLVSLYAHAYQLTKDPKYKAIIDGTLAFVERELMDKKGGFYSSLDADSDGEEGKFYVWTENEIKNIIGDETQSKIFEDYFNIKKAGNWEHGKNILHITKSAEKVAKKYNISIDEFHKIINTNKAKLFAERAKRVRPGLDNKVLTSWNALMLSGYVDAYKALGEEKHLQTALKNANFLVDNMIKKDFRLDRNYKDGNSKINAFLDDYALLATAFIGLYEVTFDEKWLKQAEGLTNYLNTHFYDEASGMYNYTSDMDPALIAKKKVLTDNVIPGSNSATARLLYKIGDLLYKPEWVKKSKNMLHNMSESIVMTPQPNFYSNWCTMYSEVLNPPYEVAIVGNEYKKLQQGLLKEYLPNALFLGGKDEGSLELLKDKLQEDETMIYVCQNKICKLPVQNVKDALELMK